MTRFAAFLRAINVGGHVVKMERLRALFEELGFSNVSTVIASGNVLFEAPGTNVRRLEERIERSLEDALGYEVRTFVRTADEVVALAAYEPFTREALKDAVTLMVVFMRDAPTASARETLLSLRTPTDEFHVADRHAFWLCRTKTSESPVFKRGSIEKTLGLPGTARNFNTVQRIAALMKV